MGVFDQELILPGTITDIQSDYSYGYDTSLFGTTDSVTIIGTAFNGPVGKPVEIYSPEHANYIFGSAYDYTTRKEATLVAEIKDAWDRGCRTIYAVRVSGKSIAKDFKMVPETNLKLRLSGIFPSNGNKDVYMVFDDTEGASKLTVFKPSKRATIQEKLEGLVDSDEGILVSTLDLSNSYGITKDSRLVELIKLFNDHTANNVLRLSIVDDKGNDVTISSKDAQSLSVGDMFPGAYFVGRSVNKCFAATDMSYIFVDENGTNKPYEAFNGQVFKELKLNTDINADLPIFGKINTLNDKFRPLVQMTRMFDFLEVSGKADLVFGKDNVDYEEVDIADFDLYKALGSGFAVAAKAEYRNPNDTDAGIKIKEAPVSDPNRIQPLNDGIYSMLENLKSDYRILTIGTADENISGKIPKKADFEIATTKSNIIFDGNVVAKAKVNAKDMTKAKKYNFVLKKVDDTFGDAKTIKDGLYTLKTVKRVASVLDATALKDEIFTEGSLFMTGTAPAFVLNRYANGIVTELNDVTVNADLEGRLFLVGDNVFEVRINGTDFEYVALDATGFGAKTFVLVETGDSVFVYAIIDGTPATLSCVGGLDEIFGNNEDKTLITVESEHEVINNITVKSAALDYTTLEEFINLLNEDLNLNKYFEFSVAEDAIGKKDEYVLDLNIPDVDVEAITVHEVTDKTIGYDMNLYIPYKTTDNFARHLAQHCTYTNLKTAPTHGILGCSKLLDVNLNSVANKVNEIAGLDLNLYAKKSNGREMLDRNNLPYPIGRNISVVAGQYVINMNDGYNFISNGAAGYAGMVSVLPLDQSSTAQPINIPTPMYEFTNFQLEKLTQKGFITFKQSYTKGFVVTDGVTMAPVSSSFRRLSVTRIINSIEEMIRTATEPFIGKQNHLANRNSMQTAIKSAIDKVKGKLIEDFEFKLVVDPASTRLGIVDIDYGIVPIYEIREVRNRISVKESL